MNKFFQSLRARLNFWIVLIGVVIFGSMACVFSIFTYEREEAEAVRFTSMQLQNISVVVDLKLRSIESSLAAVSAGVECNIDDSVRLKKELSGLTLHDTLTTLYSLAFEPYKHLPSHKACMIYINKVNSDSITFKHIEDTNYKYFERQWYKMAISNGHATWSEPYTDGLDGKTRMVTCSLPLRDENEKICAVLSADVPLENIVHEVRTVNPAGKGRELFLLTQEGNIVIDWNMGSVIGNTLHPQSVLKELDNSHKTKKKLTFNGRDILAITTTMPSTGWRLCAFITYDNIMSGTGIITLTVLFLFIAGLLALSMCIVIILRREMKPLEHFALAARKIGKGNFNVVLPSFNDINELRSLHDSLETMQTSLINYIGEVEDLTVSKQRIESELHIAHTLQMSMLPRKFPPFPERQDIDIYASLTHAKEVGGDLYDFFIHDERLFFAVGDVAGKGIPASLFMAITCNLFRMVANETTSPAEIIGKLNKAITNNNATSTFITMFVGVLDLRTSVMTYCNAGHNPPLLIATDGENHFMEVLPNLPVGVVDNFNYEEQHTVIGDAKLLLYTDGVTEAENTLHELFGDDRLEKVCSRLGRQTSEKTVKAISEAVTTHVGNAEQSDDITIMCLSLPLTLRIKNNIQELKKLPTFLNAFAEKNDIDAKTIASVNVAIEEAMVNVISYAYPDRRTDDIILMAERKGDTLRFTLNDSGKPFDPTTVVDADTSLSVGERRIGGLGIFITRTIMDNVEYKYQGDRNILTMIKYIKK